jgi:hypothetical protein
MIAAVTSILTGADTALLLNTAHVALSAAVVDIAAALVAFGLHMLWMYRRVSRPSLPLRGLGYLNARSRKDTQSILFSLVPG